MTIRHLFLYPANMPGDLNLTFKRRNIFNLSLSPRPTILHKHKQIKNSLFFFTNKINSIF